MGQILSSVSSGSLCSTLGTLLTTVEACLQIKHITSEMAGMVPHIKVLPSFVLLAYSVSLLPQGPPATAARTGVSSSAPSADGCCHVCARSERTREGRRSKCEPQRQGLSRLEWRGREATSSLWCCLAQERSQPDRTWSPVPSLAHL